MPTNVACLVGDTGIHGGLAALAASGSVSMYTPDAQPSTEELFTDSAEMVLVFPSFHPPGRSVRAQARAAGFDWHELSQPRGERDTHVLGTVTELLVRCARSGNPLEPDTVESPAWVTTEPSEKLALELFSQLTGQSGTLSLGRGERLPPGRGDRDPLRVVRRLSFDAAVANLGLRVVESSSKYRPDSCPRCEFRWDVLLNRYVGFERIASDVWTCRNCTAVVDAPMTSNRTVAKR